MAPPNNYRLWTISPSQTGISANYSNVDNFIKDSIEKEISLKKHIVIFGEFTKNSKF